MNGVRSVTTAFCLPLLAECPEGSYFRDEHCAPCPVGFYQERAGSLACTPCPVGRTTTSAGAFSQTHCKSSGPCLTQKAHPAPGAQRGVSALARLTFGADDSSLWGLSPVWQDVYLAPPLALTC